MASHKQRKLDAVVARLQLDYGPRAIRRAGPDEKAPLVPRIATSFSNLDAALGGGLPQGRITEISGPATSGKLTVAAKAIASAHRIDPDVLGGWLDLSRTCDPDYMHRCGVDLSRLLVIRPAGIADALTILLHLVETNTLALLVVDGLVGDGPAAQGAPGKWSAAEESAFAATLARLGPLLAESATAVAFITEPKFASRALAHAATLRVVLRREQWIQRSGDVRGYVAQAEVVKNRLGRAGARAAVRITFNGTVRGDGL